ncbi:L-serine dehydratase/L-threonine deaminase-like [Lineus longissimus]|uniref:L-serine dehydratase/L-threonine deaminase-like n=1 Tax=Lineus longissimus TaxID=88925 RepID=UPI00315CF3B0
MGDESADTVINGQKPLHIWTPLIESVPLSKHSGFIVHLKLDNNQPSSSFKIRGIGNLCQKAKSKGCKHIVCSSGGNAGLAAAYAARKLNLPCTVYVPTTTPESTHQKLRNEGSEVIVHGSVWNEANEMAMKAADQPGYASVHPFDHPDVWDGHSSIIEEMAADMKKPDVVITCVGGGGLLCGVVQGMKKVGWNDVPIIAMETIGSDSYNSAVKAGKLVTLKEISSVAKSLGSLTVCQQAFDYYSQHPIISATVEDKEAVNACLKFADDHRILVEPACGAAIAAIYSHVIPRLQKEGKLKDVKSVALVVCGGASVNLSLLLNWKEQFGL